MGLGEGWWRLPPCVGAIEDYEGDPEELGSERGHALHPHTAAGSKHGAMQSPCLLLAERHRAVGTVHHNTGSK